MEIEILFEDSVPITRPPFPRSHSHSHTRIVIAMPRSSMRQCRGGRTGQVGDQLMITQIAQVRINDSRRRSSSPSGEDKTESLERSRGIEDMIIASSFNITSTSSLEVPYRRTNHGKS